MNFLLNLWTKIISSSFLKLFVYNARAHIYFCTPAPNSFVTPLIQVLILEIENFTFLCLEFRIMTEFALYAEFWENILVSETKEQKICMLWSRFEPWIRRIQSFPDNYNNKMWNLTFQWKQSIYFETNKMTWLKTIKTPEHWRRIFMLHA